MYAQETQSSSTSSARRSRRWFERSFLRKTVLVVGLALAGVGISAIAAGAPHVALADTFKKMGEYLNDDGSVFVVYSDGTDFWIDVYGADGKFDHSYILDGDDGDSDPDGFAQGGEEGSVAGLIADLKKFAHGEVSPHWQDGILGKLLAAQGDGLTPVWNPGDIAGFESDELGGGGFGGFDPEGGSLASQLINAAKHGGSNNHGGDGDGDDDGVKPAAAGLWDDSMPGPPPLVNPNPLIRPGDKLDLGDVRPTADPTTKPN